MKLLQAGKQGRIPVGRHREGCPSEIATEWLKSTVRSRLPLLLKRTRQSYCEDFCWWCERRLRTNPLNRGVATVEAWRGAGGSKG